MRTIKFRAWHKTQQEWIANFMDMPLLAGIDMVLNGGVSDIEVSQYIGLDDGDGREIYEGDIIEIEGATAKVVYWERPPEFGLDASHNEEDWCDDWDLCDDHERMTVIGNVYENADLLKPATKSAGEQ